MRWFDSFSILLYILHLLPLIFTVWHYTRIERPQRQFKVFFDQILIRLFARLDARVFAGVAGF
jgi:hypothetical protein